MLAACAPHSPVAVDSEEQACAAVPRYAFAGAVTDQAELLDPAREALLVRQFAAIKRERRADIAFASVPTLGGQDVALVARCLGNRWRLGDPARQDAVLLLVAPADHKVRVALGRGLDDAAGRAMAEDAVAAMTPYFGRADFVGGIDAGVGVITRGIAARETRQ